VEQPLTVQSIEFLSRPNYFVAHTKNSTMSILTVQIV